MQAKRSNAECEPIVSNTPPSVNATRKIPPRLTTCYSGTILNYMHTTIKTQITLLFALLFLIVAGFIALASQPQADSTTSDSSFCEKLLQRQTTLQKLPSTERTEGQITAATELLNERCN